MGGRLIRIRGRLRQSGVMHHRPEVEDLSFRLHLMAKASPGTHKVMPKGPEFPLEYPF